MVEQALDQPAGDSQVGGGDQDLEPDETAEVDRGSCPRVGVESNHQLTLHLDIAQDDLVALGRAQDRGSPERSPFDSGRGCRDQRDAGLAVIEANAGGEEVHRSRKAAWLLAAAHHVAARSATGPEGGAEDALFRSALGKSRGEQAILFGYPFDQQPLEAGAVEAQLDQRGHGEVVHGRRHGEGGSGAAECALNADRLHRGRPSAPVLLGDEQAGSPVLLESGDRLSVRLLQFEQRVSRKRRQEAGEKTFETPPLAS